MVAPHPSLPNSPVSAVDVTSGAWWQGPTFPEVQVPEGRAEELRINFMVLQKQRQATSSQSGKFSTTRPANEPRSCVPPPAPSPRWGLRGIRVGLLHGMPVHGLHRALQTTCLHLALGIMGYRGHQAQEESGITGAQRCGSSLASSTMETPCLLWTHFYYPL